MTNTEPELPELSLDDQLLDAIHARNARAAGLPFGYQVRAALADLERPRNPADELAAMVRTIGDRLAAGFAEIRRARQEAGIPPGQPWLLGHLKLDELPFLPDLDDASRRAAQSPTRSTTPAVEE